MHETLLQALTLSPIGLDDFADSLHYSAGPSVMLTEVHTRLLSVILRYVVTSVDD